MGRPEAVFTRTQRVRVLATGLCTYPDASVVCGRIERDPEDRNAIVNPVVLVEVLSDSTEAYDRNEKLAHYRRIPSLRDYLLVSQHERRVEHYQRNENGTWTLRDVGAGDAVTLSSIGCVVAVDAPYGVTIRSRVGDGRRRSPSKRSARGEAGQALGRACCTFARRRRDASTSGCTEQRLSRCGGARLQ